MGDQQAMARETVAKGSDAALAYLAAAVLIIDCRGMVTFANRAAHAVFGPVDPVSQHIRALLGRVGASGGCDLAEMVDAGTEAPLARLGLADGRSFDCHIRRLPGGGGSVVSLVDITLYLHAAAFATRDSLTNLANRAGFHERLGQLLQQMKRNESPLAVLYLDLDRFKNVNDSFGHQVGDALLVKVAARLRSASRRSDVVARIGGDEFAIIQVDTFQPESVKKLAERLVDLVGRSYTVGDYIINVGASVGIAISPSDGNDCVSLLKNADLALYRAKADGKGVCRFFQPSMDIAMQKQRILESALRKALTLKQFEIVYQPQMQVSSNTLVGFEALLRWHHPERGYIYPAEFLPLAEEIGLIDRIGKWVLNTACHEAASWPQPISVAVNVSPLQFRGTALTQVVKAALQNAGLDPARLELEITEGTLLTNTHHVMKMLTEMRSLGIKISMVDFGTGYSSLTYLQKFPFDKVKIDQSFVQGADTKHECGAIIRAVAVLAATLGMKTTAEGVETPEQLERIRAAGCTEVQGYLTGRPLRAAHAAALAYDSITPDDRCVAEYLQN